MYVDAMFAVGGESRCDQSFEELERLCLKLTTWASCGGMLIAVLWDNWMLVF